jgi:hypothetical protein
VGDEFKVSGTKDDLPGLAKLILGQVMEQVQRG